MRDRNQMKGNSGIYVGYIYIYIYIYIYHFGGLYPGRDLFTKKPLVYRGTKNHIYSNLGAILLGIAPNLGAISIDIAARLGAIS